MIKEEIKIKNRLGIHARPAALIGQEAGKFKGEIFISAEQGSTISVMVNGADEDNAFKAIKTVLGKIFEEE